MFDTDEDEAITYTVDNEAEISDTSRKLAIKISYAKLVELFGEPARDASMTEYWRVNWTLDFSDGYILTIYDWNKAENVEDVTEWNVGARTFMVASRIYDILAGKEITA